MSDKLLNPIEIPKKFKDKHNRIQSITAYKLSEMLNFELSDDAKKNQWVISDLKLSFDSQDRGSYKANNFIFFNQNGEIYKSGTTISHNDLNNLYFMFSVYSKFMKKIDVSVEFSLRNQIGKQKQIQVKNILKPVYRMSKNLQKEDAINALEKLNNVYPKLFTNEPQTLRNVLKQSSIQALIKKAIGYELAGGHLSKEDMLRMIIDLRTQDELVDKNNAAKVKKLDKANYKLYEDNHFLKKDNFKLKEKTKKISAQLELETKEKEALVNTFANLEIENNKLKEENEENKKYGNFSYQFNNLLVQENKALHQTLKKGFEEMEEYSEKLNKITLKIYNPETKRQAIGGSGEKFWTKSIRNANDAKSIFSIYINKILFSMHYQPQFKEQPILQKVKIKIDKETNYLFISCPAEVSGFVIMDVTGNFKAKELYQHKFDKTMEYKTLSIKNTKPFQWVSVDANYDSRLDRHSASVEIDKGNLFFKHYNRIIICPVMKNGNWGFPSIKDVKTDVQSGIYVSTY